MTAISSLRPVAVDEIGDYPFSVEDRFESHYFMAWERRRWLNSDMRLRGDPECRALFFDLINISYDQSPVGTLPTDHKILAKLLFVTDDRFEQLCRQEFGPLHKWRKFNCEGEIRLGHPMVLKTLNEAVARRAENQARTDAASNIKRLQRMRSMLAGYSKDLASNEAAVRWIDEWLIEQGCTKRSSDWLERAMSAWSGHMHRLSGRGRSI
ncbi:hypothetical protein [Ketogulonicigenium vulgare]|uniref:Uncharacterized protein n=1 Tax=Ketogulonicigenium vulgare (strain WSH-001) TaxID=759362 RepID=F9Y4K0_KETVW|nr:hypothetical protein [Ketogulonicigenium vulgare]AEM40557.1 hypothetical protein KVU_0719 [Ketogulonicigenium vulgare WSH-001]AOZ54273.1 hypothetical protein KVC_1256 [Ketogulonicigenium vulgare]